MIDSHVHVWPAGGRHPAQQAARPLPATAHELQAVLTAAGVTGAVVIQAIVGDRAGYFREVADLPPESFALVARWTASSIDPAAELDALALRRVRGIRFDLLAPRTISTTDLRSICTAAAERSMVVEWLGRPSDLADVSSIARLRPDLVQVIDHLGLPDDPSSRSDLAIVRALAEHPNVHVKFSGFHAISHRPPYGDCREWASGVLDAFGRQRVLWGSNWPLAIESLSYPALLDLTAEIAGLNLAEIGAATARRIWFGAAVVTG